MSSLLSRLCCCRSEKDPSTSADPRNGSSKRREDNRTEDVLGSDKKAEENYPVEFKRKDSLGTGNTSGETNSGAVTSTSVKTQDTPKAFDVLQEKQNVIYHHRATDKYHEATVVGVHLDDGPDKPYYTIRYKTSDDEIVEKQTTPDRLQPAV